MHAGREKSLTAQMVLKVKSGQLHCHICQEYRAYERNKMFVSWQQAPTVNMKCIQHNDKWEKAPAFTIRATNKKCCILALNLWFHNNELIHALILSAS